MSLSVKDFNSSLIKSYIKSEPITCNRNKDVVQQSSEKKTITLRQNLLMEGVLEFYSKSWSTETTLATNGMLFTNKLK